MSELDDESLSDVCNILGMSSIFNKEETNESINAKAAERDFIKKSLNLEDTTINKKEDDILNYDPISEYNDIINNISNENSYNEEPTIEKKEQFSDNITNSGEYNKESRSFTNFQSIQPSQSYQSNTNNYDNNDDKSSVVSYDDLVQYNKPNDNYNTFKNDSFGKKLTEEEKNQKLVDNVLNFSKDDKDNYDFSIDNENREDMKLTLLEKIDNLIEELEDDGINLEKIPKVDFTTDLEKIEYVAKILMLKANRNRYSNMGEEFILALANGLEILCNGEREFLGTKPDLKGYSDVVKVKLRRVRKDTSQLVSNIVEKYEVSPLMSILIELIPGIFLHSRRKNIASYDTLYNDLSEDINEIRKFN